MGNAIGSTTKSLQIPDEMASVDAVTECRLINSCCIMWHRGKQTFHSWEGVGSLGVGVGGGGGQGAGRGRKKTRKETGVFLAVVVLAVRVVMNAAVVAQ